MTDSQDHHPTSSPVEQRGEVGHTPGPLEIVEAVITDGGTNWHVYLAAPDGRKIAALWGGQDEKIANAHLFRAASEMLVALRTAAGHIDRMAAWIAAQRQGYSFESLGEDAPSIRAAIALATGRTER